MSERALVVAALRTGVSLAVLMMAGTGAAIAQSVSGGAVSSSTQPVCNQDAVSTDGLLACGVGATASGQYATAIGANSTASGYAAFAGGYAAQANADYATAVGNEAIVNDANGSAFGLNSAVNGVSGTAIGNYTAAEGANATALGYGATAAGPGDIAEGSLAIAGTSVTRGYATAGTHGNIAIGSDSGTADGDSVAVSAQADGGDAIAVGTAAQALGGRAVALGSYAYGGGGGATAIGPDSSAQGNYSFAGAGGARAYGVGDIALGVESEAGRSSETTNYNIAIGASTTSAPFGDSGAAATWVDGGYAVGLGTAVNVHAQYGVALGTFTDVTGAGAAFGNVALGTLSSDDGETTRDVVSVGCSVNCYEGAFTRAITNVSAGVVSATSTDAINGSQLYALQQEVDGLGGSGSGGTGSGGSGGSPYLAVQTSNGAAAVSADSTLAVGGGASATAAGSVALGDGSVADRANSVSVGTVGGERQIVNVAAGTQGTDAVNLNQLTAVSVVANGALQRSGGTMTGALNMGGNAVTGVKGGTVSATSTDAVNGAQLYQQAAAAAAALGGGSAVTASGAISAPSYTLSSGTYASVGAALTGLDGRINDLGAFTQAARQEARAGVASAMAMSAAPMPSAPGRTSWTVNVSTFLGEQAFGASMAHRFEGAPFAFTAGVSYSHDIAAGRVGLMGEF